MSRNRNIDQQVIYEESLPSFNKANQELLNIIRRSVENDDANSSLQTSIQYDRATNKLGSSFQEIHDKQLRELLMDDYNNANQMRTAWAKQQYSQLMPDGEPQTIYQPLPPQVAINFGNATQKFINSMINVGSILQQAAAQTFPQTYNVNSSIKWSDLFDAFTGVQQMMLSLVNQPAQYKSNQVFQEVVAVSEAFQSFLEIIYFYEETIEELKEIDNEVLLQEIPDVYTTKILYMQDFFEQINAKLYSMYGPTITVSNSGGDGGGGGGDGSSSSGSSGFDSFGGGGGNGGGGGDDGGDDGNGSGDFGLDIRSVNSDNSFHVGGAAYGSGGDRSDGQRRGLIQTLLTNDDGTGVIRPVIANDNAFNVNADRTYGIRGPFSSSPEQIQGPFSSSPLTPEESQIIAQRRPILPRSGFGAPKGINVKPTPLADADSPAQSIFGVVANFIQGKRRGRPSKSVDQYLASIATPQEKEAASIELEEWKARNPGAPAIESAEQYNIILARLRSEALDQLAFANPGSAPLSSTSATTHQPQISSPLLSDSLANESAVVSAGQEPLFATPASGIKYALSPEVKQAGISRSDLTRNELYARQIINAFESGEYSEINPLIDQIGLTNYKSVLGLIEQNMNPDQFNDFTAYLGSLKSVEKAVSPNSKTGLHPILDKPQNIDLAKVKNAITRAYGGSVASLNSYNQLKSNLQRDHGTDTWERVLHELGDSKNNRGITYISMANHVDKTGKGANSTRSSARRVSVRKSGMFDADDED